MIKRVLSLVTGAALLLSSLAAFAHPAQDVVERTTNQIMKILSEDKERLQTDRDYLQQVIDEQIMPVLDFEAMTALSIGKHWRSATDAQKKELIEQFQQLLINTYMSALELYSGQEMTYKPFRPSERENRAVVRASFAQPNSNKGVPVNYKLRLTNGEWRIYDIDVNNINLVNTYRSTFNQRIAQSGIDGLIEEMKEKNAAAEAAAVAEAGQN
ncbi:ABC transporter substrate-binding protein [Granulosicoccaceae sp. 1_MG-2023]|nr:ABC transporter substrate-binding protein [Granulosicoccaceae sp. 1_MG-2023]